MRKRKPGKLFIVSGPSGSGKSTVLREVFARRTRMFFSVSATTRGPREGEKDGVDYYFVTKEEFKKMIEGGQLLEHAQYVGNYYGTPKAPVEEKLREGNDVVLDIEVQGAEQVKRKAPEAVSIFLLPPSLEELERRLRGRGTESDEKIRSRLERAASEMKLAPNYDFNVVNDNVEEAADEILRIMRRATHRR